MNGPKCDLKRSPNLEKCGKFENGNWKFPEVFRTTKKSAKIPMLKIEKSGPY